MMDRNKRHAHMLGQHMNEQHSSNGLLYGALGLVGGALIYHFATRRSGHLLSRGKSNSVHLEGTVNIDRPAEEIYKFWRGFSQLPKVMTFLDRIEDRGDRLTHWVVKAPMGATVEWDSKVVDDLPNQRIAWQSVEGSEIRTWGDVRFENNARSKGTKVIVNLNFEPPGSAAGAAVAQFLGGLEKAVLNKNLRNLKAFLETGEVATNLRQQVPKEHQPGQPAGPMQ